MEEQKISKVFELIKTLSVGEKRCFKELANYSQSKQTNEKQYLFLFNLLDKATIFDELLIKNALKDASIKVPLSFLNNYLWELILKSLRFYYEGKSIDTTISNLLTNADILHKRGLRKEGNTALAKAEKLASIYERHNILIEILNKQWLYKTKTDEENIKQYACILTHITIQQQYRELKILQKELISKGEIRDSILRKEWDNFIALPIMKGDVERRTFKENFYYLQAWTGYYMAINDPENMLAYQLKLIECIEYNKEIPQDYKIQYIYQLSNLVIVYCKNQQLDNAIKILEKLKDVNKLHFNLQEQKITIDIILLAYSNIIHYCFYSTLYKKAIDFSDHLFVFFKNNPSENRKEHVFIAFVRASIYKGNYIDALKWNNNILAVSMNKERENIYVLAVIYNLIILFELKQFDELQQKIRTATAFLTKQQQLFKTEKLILKYLKNKFPNVCSYKESLYLFIELKAKMEELKKDAYELKAFEYFDYTAWLQSKIENKKLMEIS